MPQPQPGLTGFAAPLAEQPVAASSIDAARIEALGARRLADLTALEAGVTDAYNAPGYWDFLAIRGFTLDNRFNYRREGLPFSAETVVPLENKARIDILRGTSGIQAGTSAPGGLVNYVVKRPTAEPLRQLRIEASGRGGLLGAVDLSTRFGPDDAGGLRLNAAHEQLRPEVRQLEGARSLLAAAADWRLAAGSLLRAELEWSRHRQPSQSGFSLLGDRLPAPASDARLNLNNQPWSQPSVFEALTGTLRWDQALAPDWQLSAQAGRQTLRTDDRLAFPFGCGAEGRFDRFCADGSFDLYDFRSDNERRLQDAAQLGLRGEFATGGVRHALALGVQASRVRNRFEAQAFNYVGTGNVQGTAFTPADPARTTPSTDRSERGTELYASDAIAWTPAFTTWLGLRHTRLQRASVRTDGSQGADYQAGLTTPWVAASYQLGAGALVYASWGEGAESQQVPALPALYANAGQVLPPLKSRQLELGAKGGDAALGWQVAAFRIARPLSNLDACARLGQPPCTGAYDGQACHVGMELALRGRGALPGGIGTLQWNTGASWLRARRQGSQLEPATDGQRPINVPAFTLRAQAAWQLAAVPGLALEGRVSHEGRRSVLADGSLALPAWTRVDATLRYDRTVGTLRTTWSLGVDNLADRRGWREAPYQFGHVYLYPVAPRTLRLAFSATL